MTPNCPTCRAPMPEQRAGKWLTWWWFERASFVLKHPDVAVGVRSVIMPSGELRPIKRETTE